MGKLLKRLTCVVCFGILFIIIHEKLTDLRENPALLLNAIEKSPLSQNKDFSISTTGGTPDTHAYNSMEHLYEERRNVILDGCKKVHRTIRGQPGFENKNMLIDKLHAISYCPIPKVGSTFWKRILTVMTSEGKLNSPFEISLGGVRLSKFDQLSKQDLNTLREHGTSFLFVRDPYARLFSGYENKIYHSNLLYWKLIGRQVVHVIRDTRDDVYNNYGFDVTFPEFIKYILYLSESEHPINVHFSPMLNRCDPCSTNFQYIGKLETFSDDANYLISKWRNEFEDVNIRFDDFEKETALDIVRGNVNFLFSTKKILDEIKFPFIKIMLRTWRDLQIRGHLSKHIKFPFKEADVDTLTKENFTEAIKKALNVPVNRTEVKLQREEALVQAYRQVPLKDMERIRHFILQDCLLFGYDDRPAKLFDRTIQNATDFVYLDGLST